MKLTTCNHQEQCRHVLHELGVAEVFRPTPPSLVCDGIVQLADTLWLVGTNNRGTITLHFLEGCTKAEAWKFFEHLRGPNTKHLNPRLTLCGPSVPNPSLN